MANATVDKLKTLGLRHGEKAVVGLTVLLCLLFLVKAFSHETIQTTPDDLKKGTEAARTNITRNATKDDILKKLEDDGIKEGNFLAVVDKAQAGSKSAEPYRLPIAFVAPEPGAGLLRSLPRLLAPEHLLAHAGRGASMMYVLDEQGNRKTKEVKDDSPKAKRPRKKRPGGFAGMGGMPGMGGAAKKKRNTGGNMAALENEKKKVDRTNRSTSNALAGDDEADPKKDAEMDEEADEEGTPEEGLQGLRWVSIVGDLNHKAFRENFAEALKVPVDAANPHYLRLDIQRMQRQADGTWPEDWADVKRDDNLKILDNIKEQEEELVPPESRLDALVDMLPFLRSGYWHKVHLASMVPAEKKKAVEVPKPKKSAGGMQGMMSGMGNMGAMGDPAGYSRMMGGGGDTKKMMGGRGMGMMAGMGSGMTMGSSGGSAYGSGGEDFQKTDAAKVMIRALDFTVEPDSVYRFRLRVVVRNPNYKVESIAPGTDNTTEELAGPWSEPSEPVNVPADVTTYAMGKVAGEANPTGDKVTFRVVRWTPEDGYTVFKQYDEAPGDIIGQYDSAAIPDAEGKKVTSKRVDFTSRQVVLDTMGGDRLLDRLKLPGTRFDAPTRALVVRPDGTLVLRDEARDIQDGEMAEMKDIYDMTIEEVKAGTKKSTGAAGGYPGMGGMGGGGRMSAGAR